MRCEFIEESNFYWTIKLLGLVLEVIAIIFENIQKYFYVSNNYINIQIYNIYLRWLWNQINFFDMTEISDGKFFRSDKFFTIDCKSTSFFLIPEWPVIIAPISEMTGNKYTLSELITIYTYFYGNILVPCHLNIMEYI